MKDFFKGFYKIDSDSFDEFWKSCIFIFDTNVLLNLYRYHNSTSSSLLNVLEKLGGRVWIPYHVGLEFQRNRLSVIDEQKKRYKEVRSIVNDSIKRMEDQFDKLQLRKRHSYIDTDPFMENLKGKADEFFKTLSDLEEESISISSTDPIREKLDEVLQSRVGPPPSQKQVDSWQAEGENRYSAGIPPGFEDAGKDSGDSGVFSYGGVLYKRKFGDLIVWKQIEEYCEKKKIKDLVFVTDDSKSDWMLKVGGKTVGVRPELVDEIERTSGVARFHIYSTDEFLNYANEYLDADIDESSIEEVRDTSRFYSSLKDLFLQDYSSGFEEKCVLALGEWLKDKYQNVEPEGVGLADMIATIRDVRFGYKSEVVRSKKEAIEAIEYYQSKKDFLFDVSGVNFFTLMLVAVNRELAISIHSHLMSRTRKKRSGEIDVIVAFAVENYTSPDEIRLITLPKF